MAEAPQPLRSGSLGGALANLRWLLGSRGVNAILSLFYIAIVTRSLGAAGFGQFALVTGTGGAIVTIISFQTWQIIVRYGTEHLHAGRPDRLARLLKGALALDAAGALLGSLIAVAAVAALAPAFGWSPDMRRDTFLFCCAALLSMRSTPTGILRLHDRFAAAAFADIALPVVRLAGAGLVLAAGPSVRGFLIAWAAAELASSIAFWISAARVARGLPWRRAPLSLPALRADNPGILHFAAITNSAQTLTLATRQLPVLLVGFFASPAAAGAYRLAHQLGRAMARVSQLFARALFPELMRIRTAAGSSAGFGPMVARIVRTAAIGGGLLLLLLLLAGRPLLELVAGPEFAAAYPLLLLLGAAAVVDLIGVAFEPALIASGQAGRSFRVQLVAAATLIGLMVVLIPRVGTIGAAAAVLAGSLLGFALMAVAVRRVLRRRPDAEEAALAASLEAHPPRHNDH
jgi:O-antigen/teichoic acid export membrane protein